MIFSLSTNFHTILGKGLLEAIGIDTDIERCCVWLVDCALELSSAGIGDGICTLSTEFLLEIFRRAKIRWFWRSGVAPDWNRSWDNRSCRDGLEDVSMNFVPFGKTRIGFRQLEVAQLQTCKTWDLDLER